MRLFGTDGIRGQYGVYPMTPEFMYRIGRALGYFAKGAEVVIGRDTRISSPEIAAALTKGLAEEGAHIVLIGVVPTNAIATATMRKRACFGISVTASHNPYHDNGIKIFDTHGIKIDRSTQDAIAQRVDDLSLAASGREGTVREEPFATEYIETLLACFGSGRPLSGRKIVLDCANGAGSFVGPALLRQLGAELVTIGATPTGLNINEGCGATHLAALTEEVLARKADIGLALDGDADRLIVVDEEGIVADGDQILARLAVSMQDRDRLSKNAVVATVLSNQGLELFLHERGLTLHRTAVGDANVADRMREHGVNLGGEQSGHFILSDHATTGDGLIAALQILRELASSSEAASRLLRVFTPMPQRTRNIPLQSIKWDLSALDSVFGEAEAVAARFGGRLLVRKSGTEPLLRIMVEGPNEHDVSTLLDRIDARLVA